MSKIGNYITYVSNSYYVSTTYHAILQTYQHCDPDVCYTYPILYQIAESDETAKLVSEIDYDYTENPIRKQLRLHLLHLNHAYCYRLYIFDISADIWTKSW